MTEKKTAKRGVGVIAIEAIRAGQTNEEALAAVLKELPDSKVSVASINWYRNKARATNAKIPTARALKAKNTKAAKAKA